MSSQAPTARVSPLALRSANQPVEHPGRNEPRHLDRGRHLKHEADLRCYPSNRLERQSNSAGVFPPARGTT
jgi:hypothetical protein